MSHIRVDKGLVDKRGSSGPGAWQLIDRLPAELAFEGDIPEYAY